MSQTATKVVADWHATTKPESYWKVYDAYLPRRRRTRFDLVEVGVFTGESLKVFAHHYPEARILGIDAELRDIDFSMCRRSNTSKATKGIGKQWGNSSVVSPTHLT